MYHLTPIQNLDSIQENGLEARPLMVPHHKKVSESEYNHRTGRVESSLEVETYETGVYLTTSEDDARRYAPYLSTETHWDDDGHEFALLAVDLSPRDDEVLRDQEDVNGDPITSSGQVYVGDAIPPENVEHVDTVVA